jgi:parallel beta-helix repeat protein
MKATNIPGSLHILMLFAAVSVVPAGRASAADYFVTPSGSDSNSGSSASPWRTLQKAANTVAAGDVVHVADGTYSGMHLTRSGTTAAPIVFKAEGANVLVNARNATTDDNINLEGASYVVIDGFVVEDAPRAGIRVVEATAVVIRNNVVARSDHTGILTGWTPGIQIIDNISYGAIAQHGIYVSNSRVSPDDVVVRGNECYGNGQAGIQLNGDCWEGGDGIISGAVIEDNLVHDNNWKGFSLISVQNSVIRNNVIWDNGITAGAGGIHLVDQPNCSKPSDNNVVVNNTISEPRIAGIRISLSSTANVLFNNIVVASSSDYTIADEVGGNWIDASSNLLRTSSTGLFVNFTGKDFHLADASAAVDAGLASYQGASAPAIDREGDARPRGNGYDVGAYEKGGTAPPPDTTPPSVAVTAPAANATVSGTTTLQATAGDDVGVVGVQFFVDGVARGAEDVQSPYQTSLNTTTLANGAHTATALARDAAGNTRTSAAVTFQVSNAPPPSNGILAGHPRLAINPTRKAELRAAACYDDNGNVIPNCTPTPQWVKLRDYVALCYNTPANCYIVQPHQFALAYVITGNVNYANHAIAKVDEEIADGLSEERDNFYLHADDKVADCAYVFDWLYDLLTPAKRATYIDYMNRIVQEIYVEDEFNNPFYNADRWATNDPGNNYYYAQMLCAVLTVLATYGENDYTVPLNGTDVPLQLYFHREKRAYSDMLQFVTDRLEREAQAAWITPRGAGGGWHEGMDYGTAAKNQIFAIYLYLKIAGATDYFATTTFPRAAARFHIYGVQPGADVRYNGGDSGRDKTVQVSPYERETAIQLARGLQGTVESQHLQNWARRETPTMGSGWQHMFPADLLWTDVNFPETDYTTLPLAFFGGSPTSDQGLGFVNSRSSWAADAVSVTFVCADRVQNHQHKDQNSFVIYQGSGLEGWLAIDANFCSESNGLSKSGAVHNILLVNGEDQRFADYSRQPVKHEFTNEYSYVIGDAADAYWTNPGAYASGNEPYLRTYLRELVHAFPNYVIVFDRVTPLAKFSTVPITYLLNTRAEPTISGSTATAESGPNKLVQKTLVPASGFTMTTANSVGCRRLQIQRSAPTPNTQFLHAIWVGPTTGSMPQTDAVTSATNNMVGAHIKEAGRNIVVMFSSEPTGQVAPTNVQFQLSTTESTTHYLFGLLPETEYRVDVTCTEGRQEIVVERGRGRLTSAQGTLRFTAEYAPDAPVQAVFVR